MQERLVDRVPPGTLLGYDDKVDAEHRRALTKPYEPKTEREYGVRWRHYSRWCREAGYQSDPLFICDATAYAYVVFQSTQERFAPETIQQSLSALHYYAERAGVDPMPAFSAARGLLRDYVVALRAGGHIRPKR